MMRTWRGLGAIGVLVLSTVDATAGETVAARLNAVAYEPVGSLGSVTVRLMDDSDANKVLKGRIERAFAGRGGQIRESGDLVITFEASNTVGNLRPYDDLGPFRLMGSSGSTDDEVVDARVTVFSTRTGGDTGGFGAYGGTVGLEIAANDRRTGHRVWQGWASADATGRDAQVVTGALVDVVLGTYGTTIREQPVDVPLP